MTDVIIGGFARLLLFPLAMLFVVVGCCIGLIACLFIGFERASESVVEPMLGFPDWVFRVESERKLK